MKTLIIEDDAISRMLISAVVTDCGHQVTACGSAEEGLEAWKAQSFPLIVLDWLLPGMDGLEFCRWVRQQPGGDQVFILVATMRNRSEDLQAVLGAGANDYIAKPYDRGMLRVRLAVAERQAHEIAERKKAEATLRESEEMNRTILRNAMDGFWLLDLQGKILEVNDAYCRMTGFSREELLQKRASNQRVDQSEEAVRQHLQRIIEVGHERFESRHRTRDGRVIEFEVSLNQVEIAGEKRLASFFRDITERQKLAEERLKSARLESIGQLAGGIAHEFNNALTAIIGNLALTQSELSPSHPAADWLGSAQSAAARATGLARQLLTFSRGGEPMKKTIALENLLRQTVEGNLHGKPVTACFVFDPRLALIEADSEQMGQVVRNVVTNAVEAMPEGGHLYIEAANVTLRQNELPNVAAGAFVCLSFRDEGRGIDPETLPRIFDPYFSTRSGASGLGLAICYSIVKKHNGHILAEAPPGGGTLVKIFLPATQRGAGNTSTPSHGASPLNGRILIMDDDPAIRDLMRILLTKGGYQVVQSEEGGEALRLYFEAKNSGQPFGLVIMDLTIPNGMGGKLAMEELRARDSSARAIVCSGYSNDPVMANFSDYGFSACLNKPFSREALAQTVASVLAQSRPS